MSWNSPPPRPPIDPGSLSPDVASRKASVPVAIATAAAIATIAATIFGYGEYRERHPAVNLSGQWYIENTIERTTLSRFQGLHVTYRVFITQRGSDLAARGEKIRENGERIPSSAHTPVQLHGSIVDDTIELSYMEAGTRRISSGHYIWRALRTPGSHYSGRFESTAANASGSSELFRDLPGGP